MGEEGQGALPAQAMGGSASQNPLLPLRPQSLGRPGSYFNSALEMHHSQKRSVLVLPKTTVSPIIYVSFFHLHFGGFVGDLAN